MAIAYAWIKRKLHFNSSPYALLSLTLSSAESRIFNNYSVIMTILLTTLEYHK